MKQIARRSLQESRSASGRFVNIWKLFLASFLSLYFELVLIRWIPSTVHVVAFFNNLVLIACFLGIGIGLSKKAHLDTAVRVSLSRLAISVALLGIINMLNPSILFPREADYGVNEMATNPLFRIPVSVMILLIFSLTAWTMIPFGQLISVYFDGLERIPAYSINILGSLVGIGAFTLLSWLQLPPVVWFLLGGVIILCLQRKKEYVLPIFLILLIPLTLHLNNSGHFKNLVEWSPYYKMIVRALDPDSRNLSDGFTIDVNDQFLLSGLDLRPEAKVPSALLGTDTEKAIQLLKSYYDFPFELKESQKVLVLGAGAGNDVAAAIRHGAEAVTAVEIDPLVFEMGIRYHPEKPYQSAKVKMVCNDARAFLNTSSEKYDLIIFATLDAHGLLSSMGNLRLDSYVYTLESLRAAKAHLAENGLMVLSFGPFREEVQFRQYATVRSVFEKDPLYFVHSNGHRAIIAGKTDKISVDRLSVNWQAISAEVIAEKFRQYPHALLLPTDNWPHLYIRQMRVPREYLSVILGVLCVAALLVRLNFRQTYALNGNFFFLGAGFLLLETKNVTEFALLMGATWQVNCMVFAMILTVILLANFLAASFERMPRSVLYGLMFFALMAAYRWPIGRWSSGDRFITGAIAVLYLGTPIFLASLIFALTFKRSKMASAALASNLIGAVLGGLMEYLSLAFGLRSLSLLALAMYAFSFLFWKIEEARSSV